MANKKKFDTLAVRLQTERSAHSEHSVPVFETSSFVFSSAEQAQLVFAEEAAGNIYTRFSNPNTDELIKKLCALEGAEDGLAVSSGMAAVFLCCFGLLQPGDHIVASRQLFGTTHLLFTQVLPKWGISHTYTDIDDEEGWKNSIMPNTRMMFAETPANPGLEIADLKFLGKLTTKHNLYLIIDNSFATPYLQNPLKFGADLVVHSATKYIDGQGRTISGALIGKGDIIQLLRPVFRTTGPTLSPHSAWLLSKSLETLSSRMDRHCSNALALAAYLENHSEVQWVRYPFLPSHPQYELAQKQMSQGGGMVTFELKGGRKRAFRFVNALSMISISSNLGDTRTIITHPATTSNAKLIPAEKSDAGITDGMLRLSVGLEHPDDLIADIQLAIRQSKRP
jgi:O-succinylhomoserine sulfhydrylase